MSTTARRIALAVAAAAIIAPVLAGCSLGSLTQRDTPGAAVESSAPAGLVDTSQDSQNEVDLDAQAEALELYVTAARPQVEGLIDTFDGLYTSITVDAVGPDTVAYTYVFTDPVDVAAGVEHFEGMIPTFQSLVETQMIPELIAMGITVDPKVSYTYLNPDGSLIWTRTFER